MKNFLKITGYTFASILLCLYLAFLFILPNKINLNVYKPDIQKLVKENTDLIVDFDKVKVITTPLLEAGIKTKNITVKLPDGSVLFSADSFKGKVFLPSLLWLSVNVTCADIENPTLNIEIINSEKYKVAKVFEDLVNRKRAQKRANPQTVYQNEQQNELPIDPSSIKLYIPALKLNNYKAIIDDTKASHKLTLKGEQLKVGYFNGKSAKLKTYAEFFSDNDKNITLDLDIDSLLPEFTPAEKTEEDEDAVFELPFVNPINVYRDYNLKSNLHSKIKIRKNKHNGEIWAKGNIDITNTTVTLSGLELPKSYYKLNAKGHLFEFDTNIYATNNEYMKLFGSISNNPANKFADITFKSTQVHFNNLIKIAQAYLDTIHIKNDFANMSASGYLFANFRVKTDFNDMKSNGKFIIRGGNIHDNNIGLLFNNMNANISFDNDILNVQDTRLLINQRPLKISGKIDDNSIANLNITADKIPLRGIFMAFAPRDIKNSYDLKSGFLTLDAKITGEIKNIISLLKADLEDFAINDKNGNFVISNKLSRFGIVNYAGTIKGKFKNNDLQILLPSSNSLISDKSIIADLNNEKIVINPSDIIFNRQSIITFNGSIDKYLTSPKIEITANGAINGDDVKIFAGQAAAPYLETKGAIPLKASIEANKQKLKTVLQMQSDINNYITPVIFDELYGKQILLQLLAEKNGDSIKVYKSGLYIRRPNAIFRDNLKFNLLNSKEIIGIRAMVSNLSTTPFLNLLKLKIHKDLKGSICVFPQSEFVLNGGIDAFGNLSKPKINGNLDISDIKFPQWLTNIRNIGINIRNQDLRIDIRDVNANGSDFNIIALTNFNLLTKTRLSDIRIYSRLLDIDKLLQVSDSIVKALPQAENSNTTTSQNNDIPIEILRGNIDFRTITTGNIVARNTTAKIVLLKSILYINDLKTLPLGGKVNGDISVNLSNQEINAKISGKEFNIEKLLADLMQMKDTLSGDMNFIADISLKGTTIEEQMKSLKGYVDFNIKNGQLGPFGKFENFLMAENIRENAFFSSTIGSVITNIVTFDTSHFNNLFGHLTFNDGFANITPIKSQGNVMALYIAGKVGLLDNSADMKLRGKLGSTFSDSLGPLANINPVNLVKNTPGLNVVAAKSFAIFCEAVSEEEMKAIPSLAENKSDDYATKFQIVLRGDTRKPLKMIKSFKWLASNAEIESAKNFVDTIPVPEAGEEGMSVDELIKLRQQQAIEQTQIKKNESKKSVVDKLKNKFKHNK
ncbi:hypothetical protein IJ541_10700 [bacterium]|nr:hypothetical protein [bacterium]